MPQKHIAEPIDRLIQNYETFSHLLELFTHFWRTVRDAKLGDPKWKLIIDGPATHWQKFREHLLRIHVEGFDYKKFVGPSPVKSSASETFPHNRWIASQVASWTKSSRRIYKVPEDLQLLLCATSLDDVNWGMVRWPFDSFLISLATPITLGDDQVDSILVGDDLSEESGGIIKFLTPIPLSLKTHKDVFVGDQSERIAKAIQHGDIAYANEKLGKIITNRLVGSVYETLLLRKDTFSDNGLASSFETMNWQDSGMQRILRVVFGLLLYLQTLPTPQAQSSEWKPTKLERVGKGGNKITLASEVCNITSIYKLTERERIVLRKGLEGKASEVSSHYREGHWRRPPGKGDDPNYPKTVWVRPTIVRLDKLEDGGLPGGSEERL